MAFPLLDILSIGKEIFDRVIPDPQKKLEANLALAKLAQDGEFKEMDNQLAMMKAQTDINLVEASSTSLFVSGWRPCIGWICAAALAYQYLFRPLAPWLLNLLPYFHMSLVTPFALDDTINQLLLALLGLGTLRTVEKVKGV